MIDNIGKISKDMDQIQDLIKNKILDEIKTLYEKINKAQKQFTEKKIQSDKDLKEVIKQIGDIHKKIDSIKKETTKDFKKFIDAESYKQIKKYNKILEDNINNRISEKEKILNNKLDNIISEIVNKISIKIREDNKIQELENILSEKYDKQISNLNNKFSTQTSKLNTLIKNYNPLVKLSKKIESEITNFAKLTKYLDNRISIIEKNLNITKKNDISLDSKSENS